jgi:hypothetical protein
VRAQLGPQLAYGKLGLLITSISDASLPSPPLVSHPASISGVLKVSKVTKVFREAKWV